MTHSVDRTIFYLAARHFQERLVERNQEMKAHPRGSTVEGKNFLLGRESALLAAMRELDHLYEKLEKDKEDTV